MNVVKTTVRDAELLKWSLNVFVKFGKKCMPLPSLQLAPIQIISFRVVRSEGGDKL